MTNEEWIRSLSGKDLAHELLRMTQEPDYGDDDDGWGLPFFRDVYICSDDVELLRIMIRLSNMNVGGLLKIETKRLKENYNAKKRRSEIARIVCRMHSQKLLS